MTSLNSLLSDKVQLELALEHVNKALESEEYSKPYSFSMSNPLSSKEFKSETVKRILDLCESRYLGFDPNLFLQHVESEVLDQFNDTVKTEIKGKSVPSLMEMRHEIELFMLNDRKKQHTHNLGLIDKQINKIKADLESEEDEPVLEKPISLSSVATKKKKG